MYKLHEKAFHVRHGVNIRMLCRTLLFELRICHACVKNSYDLASVTYMYGQFCDFTGYEFFPNVMVICVINTFVFFTCMTNSFRIRLYLSQESRIRTYLSQV